MSGSEFGRWGAAGVAAASVNCGRPIPANASPDEARIAEQARELEHLVDIPLRMVVGVDRAGQVGASRRPPRGSAPPSRSRRPRCTGRPCRRRSRPSLRTWPRWTASNCIQPIAPAELGPMFWPKFERDLVDCGEHLPRHAVGLARRLPELEQVLARPGRHREPVVLAEPDRVRDRREADVAVIPVIRQRERRAAERHQRDDLVRLHLGREHQDAADRLLGDRAATLVADDVDVVDRRHVDGEAVDVRRDHAGPRVQPVPGDQARDRDLVEGLREVLDRREHADVDASRGDVVAATRVDAHAGVVEDLLLQARLRPVEAANEGGQADGVVVVRERDRAGRRAAFAPRIERAAEAGLEFAPAARSLEARA